jgi:hypothetical protein
MKQNLLLFVLVISLFISAKYLTADDTLPSYHPFKSAKAQERVEEVINEAALNIRCFNPFSRYG